MKTLKINARQSILLAMLLLCAAQSCKVMTPSQKIALQISNVYKSIGMNDSAKHWLKVSKTLR